MEMNFSRVVGSRKITKMRVALAVLALLFQTKATNAFVSSSFAIRGSGEGIGAAALTRSSGAMRSRPTMSVIDVNSSDELDKITAENKDKLVVVDYSTTWCGPCKMVLPKYEALAAQYSESIFLKVIGDSSNDSSLLMKREGVRSVPSFHFWKGGKKVDSLQGANEEDLEETLRGFH
ncbi:unnamed protein product [Ascophyllum nodosum]